MRKFFFFFFLFPFLSIAQNKGITYQAVILKPISNKLNSLNKTPLANSPICLKFAILDSNKNIEYQEVTSVITDLFGMINVVIGYGKTMDLGSAKTFEEIDWGNSDKFLEVSVNFEGVCENFEIISTQKFNTVPFANFASNAKNITGLVSIENGGTNATNIQDAKVNLLLNNIDNTADIDKPISKATSEKISLLEKISNKSTDGTFSSNSDEKYPTEKATKTYIDNAIANNFPSNNSKDANVVDAKKTLVGASKIESVLAIENGGTGSSTKNFVDLTTNQTVLGNKTFEGSTIFSKDMKVGNIKFGYGSGNLSTNTIIGTEALNTNITGKYNTALGLYSLNKNLSSYNTAIGHYTLVANTSGYANTALGAQALFLNETGSYNLAAGVSALQRNMTGINNTAIGGNVTMLNNVSGNHNTALGFASMYTNVSGSENVGLGIKTLYDNVSGNNNIAIGASAGYHSKDSYNIYLGYASGYNTINGNSNIYIGTKSGVGSSGNKNIVIGDNITNVNPSGDEQLNIGNIIKGNLISGDIEITGNIIAKNLSGINTGDNVISKPVYQTSAIDPFIVTSSSYSIISLQITIAEEGDYLVNFSSSYENNTSGSLNMISIFIDDQIFEPSERRDFFNNALETRNVSTISYLTGLHAGQLIDVRCKVSTGEAKLYNRTLIVQKN